MSLLGSICFLHGDVTASEIGTHNKVENFFDLALSLLLYYAPVAPWWKLDENNLHIFNNAYFQLN